MEERLNGIEEVVSSNLIGSTKYGAKPNFPSVECVCVFVDVVSMYVK